MQVGIIVDVANTCKIHKNVVIAHYAVNNFRNRFLYRLNINIGTLAEQPS